MGIIEKKSLVEKNEYTQQEKLYIKALNNTLRKNNISETYYSLYGYGESCICLQKQGGKWIVFEGEREMKFNKLEYSSVDDACKDLLNRVADKSNFEKLQKDFYAWCILLSKYNFNRTRIRYKNVSHIMRSSYTIPSRQKVCAQKLNGVFAIELGKGTGVATTSKNVGNRTTRDKSVACTRPSVKMKKVRNKIKKYW